MLRAILAIMTPAAGALCVEDLAARLDVSASALDGMLQTLVQRGYLVEVADAASPCDACAWRLRRAARPSSPRSQSSRGGCLVMRAAGRRYARAGDRNRRNDRSPSRE
ncbi:helix-turn-helix domain-containing protein [Candidatus Amarolinea aalborgensis]|mgnify:CR=1 FL=1|jgi:hypothetical protein|uniref:helix-turn-helix domain-containing protein n=1 Tax=Candidatus Amarolinea aalborgensis TaxID=2249329 RepID=UPI003BF99196